MTQPTGSATVSRAHCESLIVTEQYHVFPGTQVTVCCLTVRNGYSGVGYSACVTPANFDAVVGKAIARDNALSEIQSREAYLLCERMA